MTRRILTIDDNVALRQFIQRTLTKNVPGHNLSFASAGADGLGLAGCEKPDLILLDFNLPDIAGNEVCRGLQADPETADLPVILMGGRIDDLQKSSSEFANIVGTITKPFTTDQLCHAVTTALSESCPAPAGKDGLPGLLPTAPAPGKDLFTLPPPAATSKYPGDTGGISLLGLLLELERDEFNGKVSIQRKEAAPVDLYLHRGKPQLVTTPDVTAYLACSGYKPTAKQSEALASIREEQAQGGTPAFLLLAERKLMPRKKALALTREQNHRLFTQLWTAPRAKFAFDPEATLPALAGELTPFDGPMKKWALESIQLVGQDLSAERDSGKIFSLF